MLDNDSTEDGGGLWVAMPMSLVDTVLQGNSAGGEGGALFTSASISGERVDALQNTAATGGFAHVTDSGELELLYGQFDGNTASTEGAAVFTTGSVHLVDTQVSSSSCPGGGALTLQGSGEFDLERVQFTTNLDFDLSRNGQPCTFETSQQITGLCNALDCDVCE